MLNIILLVLAVLVAGYFALRYIFVMNALKVIRKELDHVQQDLSQNQILFLPVPDPHLRKLIQAFNSSLEGIQKERQQYEKREREFQNQIENISHDLRTPITVILGHLKLFKASQTARLSSDQELLDILFILERKAEVMKDLVSQFYDYSRLSARDYELTLHQVDVARALKESLMDNHQMLEQASLLIDAKIPDHPVLVLGDSSALERIFLNLLHNAGKYADTFLHITLKAEEKDIIISFVNDTRILTEGHIPHLFERFYRQNSFQSGTGLGLTIAQKLTEEMHGALSARTLDHETTESKSAPTVIQFELRLKSF